MKVGIPREVSGDELRVAASPKTVKRLIRQGFQVMIATGAGDNAKIGDNDFEEAGAEILSGNDQIYQSADLILKVQAPTDEEIGQIKEGTVLASFIWPAQNDDLLNKLARRKINTIAMDAIPRISRAQKMDVLSSMSNIAGYRSVIEGANHFGRFLNGQITAAGKIDPAKVLVIGAGVAGLAALGAAHSLGAIVRAFDTRKDVAEQVESMGAQFLFVDIEEDGSSSSGYSKVMSKEFIDAEMTLFREQCKEVDIVITTALIPGKPAPLLITKDMVETLKPGSVVVDLAYAQGGNCEVTRPGEIYDYDGVTIVGKLSQLPAQASHLYGNNLCHLLDDMGKAENFKIDMEDDVISRAMVVYDGQINWPPKPLPVQTASKVELQKADVAPVEKEKMSKGLVSAIVLGALGLILFALGQVAPPEFLSHFTVFVLACFVGWQVVWNVSHSLHTPLMSVTNAISGIIILGGILHIGPEFNLITILATIAVLVASINIAGGFFITHRMLKMFRR